MALTEYLVPIRDTSNICFFCKRACGGCSWSESFDPVPGWTAAATRRVYRTHRGFYQHVVDSYHITACPEYEPDDRCSNSARDLEECVE